MTTELWSALIAGAVSLAVSVISTRTEIKKTERDWRRQDRLSADDEFAQMASAVSRCARNHTRSYLEEAAALVSAVRSRETGALADVLDDLYSILQTYPYDPERIDATLTRAIEEKRKKRKHKNSNAHRFARK